VKLTADTMLARWREALPVRFSPHVVAGFLDRNGVVVGRMFAVAAGRRTARRGESPDAVEAFEAYTDLVNALPIAERSLAPSSDGAVLKQLLALVDADLKDGDRTAIQNVGVQYIDTRAEALVMRRSGWDVVALMTASPVLVLLQIRGTRPKARGDYLVFWHNPHVAIKAPKPLAGDEGTRVQEAMADAGFEWSPALLRYQAPASDQAWAAALDVVERLTPGTAWSFPDDKTLSALTKLSYGASWWGQPGGPPPQLPEPFVPKVVLVRNAMLTVSHHPERGLQLDRYIREFNPVMTDAEDKIRYMYGQIRAPGSTLEALGKYAHTIWKMARTMPLTRPYERD
jgi:hypothetical protein